MLLKSLSWLNRSIFLGGPLSWQILHELQGLNTFLVHADDLEIQQRIPELDLESPKCCCCEVPQHISFVQLLPLAVPGMLRNHQKKWYALQKMQVGKTDIFFSVSKFKQSTICPFSICNGQFGLISSSAHQLF